MSLRHLTEADFAAGHRMACQTFILQGEVSVSWVPKPKPGTIATPTTSGDAA